MNRFVEMLREMFEKSETERIKEFDLSYIQRDDMIRYDNLKYGPDAAWNTLDLYRPRDGSDKKMPVIISVHGGGWIYGSKEGYQYYCMTLAEKGYAVINFNYRLAPKFHFPAPMEDLNTLMHWLFTNAQTYQLDLEQLYAVGDSAGAHILGAYAAICTNESYASNFSFEIPAQNCFKAIALNSGVYYSNAKKKKTDFVRILVYEYLDLNQRDSGGDMCGEDLEKMEKTIDLFEYVNYVTERYPDTFVMTAADDFVKEQSARFAMELVKKSVNSELRMYVSREHRLEHVFHCDLRLHEAETCNQDEIEFFRKYEFKNKGESVGEHV